MTDPLPAEFHLTLSDSGDDAPRDLVRAGLRAYNDAHTAAIAEARGLEREIHPLDVFLRDAAGAVVGGLVGYSHWGWLHVQQLWLPADLRGQGYGRRLMAAAEAEAIRRGCAHGRLGTYSFQAREFYERLGYTVYGRLDDYPPGHVNYAMRKDL